MFSKCVMATWFGAILVTAVCLCFSVILLSCQDNSTKVPLELISLALIIVSTITSTKIYLKQNQDKILLGSTATECKINYDLTKQRTYEIVAHELRVPLQIIVSYLGLLRLNNISISRQSSAYEKIDKAVARINSVVDTMLFLASDSQPEFKSEDITIVIEEAVKQIKGLTDNLFVVKRNLDKPVFLDINEPIFTSFLYNILSNAIKYSSTDKPITLGIEQVKTSIIIRISDQGIGIPESELKYLFSPFFRASNAKKIKGTGLGLVVAKKSVEMHSGELSVSSTLGVGTTFTASFPFVV